VFLSSQNQAIFVSAFQLVFEIQKVETNNEKEKLTFGTLKSTLMKK
jgi:hypothetical protein